MTYCSRCYAKIKIGEPTCPQCGEEQSLWWKECGLKGLYKEMPIQTSVTPAVTDSLVPNPTVDSEQNSNKEEGAESHPEPGTDEYKTDLDEEDLKFELARLMERANARFEAGRAWLGSKDRAKARREFERAFKYYGEILKVNPTHQQAREYRAKCLQKIC